MDVLEIITEATSDAFIDVVAEMANDSTSAIEVPVDRDKLERYLAADPDSHPAKFVTVEIKSGFSKSKRNWRPEILEGVAKQINEQHPVGNKGHIKKEDYDTIYPEPQTVWLGATVVRNGNQAVLRVKGYNLPGAAIRRDLQFDAVNGVSVYGKSKLRPISGGHEVVEFDLETIDWSRKNRSGMAASVVSVTAENAPGGNTVEPKDVAALSEDEIRTHAPLLVKEIERKACSPLDEKIGEMTTKVEAADADADVVVKVKELLKLTDGDNVVEKITALVSKIEDTAKSEIKDFIRTLVAKKVKTERGQGLVLRLVGEMESGYDGPLDNELRTKIESDFNAKIETDDDVKAVIGEMGSFSDGSGRTRGGVSLGGKSRTGENRGRVGATESGVVRETGNLKVTKRRFS